MLTTIRGSTDKQKLEEACLHYADGLLSFLSPESLAKSKRPYLSDLSKIRSVVSSRVLAVVPLLTDILWSINNRACVIGSKEYQDLAKREKSLWQKDQESCLEVGIRACVDAGLTREAVAGTDAYLGRSLAGDDELLFVPEIGQFRLAPSVLRKKLVHAGRGGKSEYLEILIEHTGCGRRGQMLANLHTHSGVTRNFDVVLPNVAAILDDIQAKKIKDAWEKGMNKDGGVWAGILVKMAQRQAYLGISETRVVAPIMLYDKFDGNLWVGVDNPELLLDVRVIGSQGLKNEMLELLAREGKIWSLREEMKNWEVVTNKLLTYKGKYSFVDLQHNWLEVKKAMIEVVSELWEENSSLQESIERYLKMSRIYGESEIIRRRYTHQLFRMFSYMWVLDTFKLGNAPGKHMEDHLASGESSVLGVKEHLPLGQGGLQLPTATEFFTGRSVLLHSTPGEKGEPIVVIMKHDTSEPDDKPLTGEETQRAMDDFEELLKLWPYILVGDLIPVVAVRSKQHMGISRLALSVIRAYGDVVELTANDQVKPGDRDTQYGILPEIVPASNKNGEVVLVAASEILRVGIEAGSDLRLFRKLVTAVADVSSNETVQGALRAVVS